MTLLNYTDEPASASELVQGNSLLRIYMLGEFRVCRGDLPIDEDDWTSKKARSLLKYLASVSGHRAPRERVAEMLWPDKDPDTGRKNLNYVVHCLRNILEGGKSAPTRARYITTDGETITLSGIGWVDADAFEVQAAQCLQRSSQDSAEMESALALYRGDYLPHDPYEDWTQARRRSLFQLFVSLAMQLADTYTQAGDYPKAIAPLQQVMAYDPIRDDVHQKLMLLYTQSGERSEAIHLYHAYLSLLESQGMEPSPESERLYEDIKAGRVSLGAPPSQTPVTPMLEPHVAAGTWQLRLFGRATEMDALDSAYRAVRAGQGYGVVFGGEAGIGKTSLATAFVEAMAASGAPVLIGAAYDQERLPYGPFTEALRKHLRALPPERIAALLGPVSVELGPLLPDLCQPPPPPETPVTRLPPDIEKNRLFQAVVRVLTAISAPRPAVLVLDDLQWADEPTIELTHYVVRNLAPGVLLPVLMYRDTDVDQTHALTNLLSDLERSRRLRRCPISPLSLVDTAALIAHVSSERNLSHRIIQAIYHKTKGNPFYAEEVVQTLRETGALADIAIDRELALPSIPPNVKNLISRRLRLLTKEDRAVLDVAALIGREVEYQVLCLAHPEGEAQVVDALDHAVQLQLLTEQNNLYRFRHDLVRETLSAELTQARKARHHLSIGLAIEQLAGSQPEMHAEALAHHFSRTYDDARAIIYLAMAGDHARGLYMTQPAISYYREAIGRAAKLKPDAAATQPLAKIHEAMGDMLELSGDYSGALASYDEALARMGASASIYRKMGEVKERQGDYNGAEAYYAQAEAHARAASDVATASQIQISRAMLELNRGNYATAASHTEPLMADLRDTGSDGLLQALHVLAVSYSARGDHTRALAAVEEGLELARSRGDRRAEAGFWEMRGRILSKQNEWEQAIVCYEASRTTREQIGDLQGLAASLNSLGNVYLSRRAWDDAITFYTKGLAIRRHIGDAHGIANSLANLGLAHHRRGDWNQAIAYHQEGLALFESIGFMIGIAYTLINLGVAACDQGHWDDAEGYFRRSLALCEEKDEMFGALYCHFGLVRLHCLRADSPAALDRLTLAMRIIEECGFQGELAEAHSLLSEAYLLTHQIEQADDHAERAIALATEEKGDFVCRAHAARGRIAAMQGDLTAATRHFSDSLTLARNLHARYAEALALADYGVTLRTFNPGQWDTATLLLKQAQALFAVLGARKDEERVARALA